jgi:hypothetical protein
MERFQGDVAGEAAGTGDVEEIARTYAVNLPDTFRVVENSERPPLVDKGQSRMSLSMNRRIFNASFWRSSFMVLSPDS